MDQVGSFLILYIILNQPSEIYTWHILVVVRNAIVHYIYKHM